MTPLSTSARPLGRWLPAWALTAALAGCGGGGGGSAVGVDPPASSPGTPPPAAVNLTAPEAHRLALQASFGATEADVTAMTQQTAAGWVAAQMRQSATPYTLGGGDAVHKGYTGNDYCNQPANASPTCLRDWLSGDPVTWDFYRHAVASPDQLRQRVAFALSQLLVVSSREVSGTYGLRRYQNQLLEGAFGNYRDVLRRVALSPVMGDYLGHVNNDKVAPNENFARELLQLFTIGPCLLTPGGDWAGGTCQPTYGTDTVRAYAYALTGWTYPAGGMSSNGRCWPRGANCRYLDGDMVPLASLRDGGERQLLAGVSVPAGATAPEALERVLDSVMAHANLPPFLARHLIGQLVTSNPSAGYVQRVGQAFTAGRYTADGQTFGTGRAGDLAATVAAVLLDTEARSPATRGQPDGKLREPAVVFAHVLRALHGQTDGEALTHWWGELVRQRIFASPSVFNYYPADYRLPGTTLRAPEFGILNANTGLARLNYLTFLLMWDGADASDDVPGATGTRVDLAPWQADAHDPAALVDRLARLATGAVLPAAARDPIVAAVVAVPASGDETLWRRTRVQQAAFLVFASPAFHVQ